MKICKICNETKELTEFHKSASTRDRLDSRCKSCKKVSRRKSYLDNKEETLRQCKEYYEENKEYILSRNAQYYRDNKEWFAENARSYYLSHLDEYVERRKRYYSENKHIMREAKARRRAAEKNANVEWADQDYIKDLYAHVKEAEDVFGAIGLDWKFHVDHIVPLQHDLVCGLHCEENLQVLSAEENLRKHNKFEV